ncbi:hypothetical protein A2U01_0095950, partial [Trifolium medium]|nr:hypothetical protein [Trifolium medium]
MFGCPARTCKLASNPIERDSDSYGSPPTLRSIRMIILLNQFWVKQVSLASQT